MYEALVSADVVAPDPDGCAARLVSILGLPEPRASAYLEPEGHGFRAVWLRTNPSLAVAPTRIEVIGLRPRDAPHEYLAERISAQGHRSVRTHATVLAGDVDQVLAHVRANGVPHRLSPAGDDFPFPRLWIGVSDAAPDNYDPSYDSHLWLEVVPTAYSGVPEATDDPPVGRGPQRVLARRFVVHDVGAAVRSLAANLGLRPAVDQPVDADVAVYRFSNPNSAAIEIIRPERGPDLDLLLQGGPGPATVVIGVGDLDHMRDRVRQAGVEPAPGVDRQARPTLELPPEATGGLPIELVASPASASTLP